MANYMKKLVTCMDCDTRYYEMVLNGAVAKFIFRCKDCSGEGTPMFGRKVV